MFGWRRKKDGFVWKEYVRTTILVRRENRRQRVEDIKDAAVDGIKHAGREGVALTAAGTRAAALGMVRSAAWLFYALYDAVTVGASATGLWLADKLAGARPVAKAAGSWLVQTTRNPRVSTTLFAIGGLAALAASARWGSHGFDATAILAALGAITALLLSALPKLADLKIGARLGNRMAALPMASKLRAAAGPLVNAGLVIAGAIAVMTWLVPSLMATNQPTVGVTTHPAPAAVQARGRIEGKASVVAGDQIRLGGQQVKLAGIEAPEQGQTCVSRGSKSTSCTANAKAALQKLVAGKQVTCDVQSRQQDGPVTAACQVNGADIAGQLVRGGDVFALTGLFATYASAEREARTAKAGLWRGGEALRPADYRAKVWADAKQQAPDGCPIKGVLSGDARSYIVPWAQGYDKAKIKPAKGDRWFCSEDEARAAGWTPGDPS